MNIIKIQCASNRIFLTNPVNMTFEFISKIRKNLYFNVVDWTVSILFYRNVLENWSIFQANGLFWTKTKVLFVMNFTEIRGFYVYVLCQSVNLLSFRFICWEKISLELKFFGLIKILDFKKDWFLNTECSWSSSIKFSSSEFL